MDCHCRYNDNYSCNHDDIYFQSFSQNDSSEFLHLLMDFLHSSIKKRINISIKGKAITKYDKLKLQSIKSWKSFFENNYSSIIDLFYSEVLSFTSCSKCPYITTNHEPIMVIILTLQSDFHSLYDCLHEYIGKNLLDSQNTWTCDTCKENNCPSQKKIFWKLSPIIIFEIKQYTSSRKLNKHIDFPSHLDMSNYCVNVDKKNTSYKLSGICNHSGGLGSGHYYANCLNHIDNQWYEYNDTHVSPTKESDILQKNPYCLFYSRSE